MIYKTILNCFYLINKYSKEKTISNSLYSLYSTSALLLLNLKLSLIVLGVNCVNIHITYGAYRKEDGKRQ